MRKTQGWGFVPIAIYLHFYILPFLFVLFLACHLYISSFLYYPRSDHGLIVCKKQIYWWSEVSFKTAGERTRMEKEPEWRMGQNELQCVLSHSCDPSGFFVREWKDNQLWLSVPQPLPKSNWYSHPLVPQLSPSHLMLCAPHCRYLTTFPENIPFGSRQWERIAGLEKTQKNSFYLYNYIYIYIGCTL